MHCRDGQAAVSRCILLVVASPCVDVSQGCSNRYAAQHWLSLEVHLQKRRATSPWVRNNAVRGLSREAQLRTQAVLTQRMEDSRHSKGCLTLQEQQGG